MLKKKIETESKFNIENSVLSSYTNWILIKYCFNDIILGKKIKTSSTLATGYFLNKTVVESFNLF